MRASRRRSHHSSSSAPGVKRPRIAKPSASSAASAARRSRRLRVPSGAASAACGDRPQPFEPAAQDLDQRRLPPTSSSRIGRRARRSSASSVASGHSALELRQALGGDPDRDRPAACEPRDALARAPARRSQSLQPGCGLASLGVTKPSQTSASCSSSALAASGQASPRTRAMASGSSRPRSAASPAPASAGSSPPGCGAPRAAHRRDRRRAAPTGPPARAARAAVRSRPVTTRCRRTRAR